jgi:hypothetical protein
MKSLLKDTLHTLAVIALIVTIILIAGTCLVPAPIALLPEKQPPAVVAEEVRYEPT